MRGKDIIISLAVIAVVIILPHTELIPNFGYSIPIFLLVWWVLRSSSESFSDIGFSLKRFTAKAFLIGAIVAIFSLAFMQLVFFPLLENFVVFEETEVGLYAFIKANIWQYLFIVVMGWLVGGFYEEVVFHGFVYSRLEKMIQGKYSKGINFMLTASIFGAYHYQLGTAGLINAFLVGAVYLALFLYFKRNLWYSVFCHGAYNTMVMTMIYYDYL